MGDVGSGDEHHYLGGIAGTGVLVCWCPDWKARLVKRTIYKRKSDEKVGLIESMISMAKITNLQN